MSNHTAEERAAWDGYMAGIAANIGHGDVEHIADYSATLADAMLAERRKRFAEQVEQEAAKPQAVRLGDLIRIARRGLNMRQVEFASNLGVSHSIISYWETHKNRPKHAMFDKIAATLGLDPATLRAAP